MTEINGLFPTPTRRALLRAIAYDRGRIYAEAGQVRDKLSYRKVTAQVKEFIDHGWVRALEPGEPRQPGESALLIYYRVTKLGETAMRGES